ncbi:glycosyltransferase family 4 protein [Paracoccus sp. 1_MG-2023]|uniref:glycosyltransferase family 4 protein n=1 Tax=unclassified Paracoccus (in: a-proteobacteria) TaxID=2688777 RepID=UPI001C08D62C|nr:MULTISPECIES: glycosyltransferase family 4 protein [unclassified Paracoccus (in: a-proteobacteria)]MBU2957925.1 glycosyltransferase family 4 protein [Paracoccus sp. C2R09]MDO6668882.1 glycosyltransferase family 4 protein [Paracoccus sp. 1_MG-2023]
MPEASRKPAHVVHVTEAPLGGVVSYLDELLGAQLRSDPDMRIDLITPEINRDALSDLDGDNFRMIAFDYGGRSPLALMKLAATTLRHVRRTRPDILHIHSTFAGAAIRVLKPLMPKRTRVIYCPHGWAFARTGSGLSRRGFAAIERGLARCCDSIVCISDHERREAGAHGIPSDRLVVVENGISPRASVSTPTERQGTRRLIAFAGRFDRQKGFDTFLDVMRQLRDEADAIAIGSIITSKGDMPEIPDNVQILGWQSRAAVFDLYRRADLLLVPSRWEGFGLVAAEAMQAGTAVFASCVGGLQDIVLDGETGRLFEPDDAAGIVRLIRMASDDDLTRFGRNGRNRYLARYTAERMAADMAALYAALLRQDAGHRDARHRFQE